MTTDLFNTPFGIKMDMRAVVSEIIRYMWADEKRTYKIVIGTDSALYPDKTADFVTAVVVCRVGNGGRYFWRHLEAGKFHILRSRIIHEVLLSLDVAKEILDELKKAKAPAFDFEIHADIGEHGETKAMIQEVVGIIRANNFEARTKPESYAASKVADRYV